jgi:large subunit ribosomal protein L28
VPAGCGQVVADPVATKVFRLDLRAALAYTSQQFYRGAYCAATNGALIMAKRCQLTGKSVMSGNNVSHANNRTRRRFLPNLQSTSMQSEILNRKVSLRVSTSAMRTVEKHGGLDAFLLQARNAELADEAQQLKREIVAAQAAAS